MKETIICMIALIILAGCSMETTNYKNEIIDFQNEMNAEFSNPETSPLTKSDIITFKKLNFFPINKDYCIEANIELAEKTDTLEIQTSTDRRPRYFKYGIAHFEINDTKHKINLYRNIELIKKEEYKNHVFMLFTDETSGIETYGGGRYIDLELALNNKITIDFNKAYNPYCAYNYKYSCPIPPEEDHLNTRIEAGVKKYH